MSFVAKLQRALEVLQQQGRLSVRALGRELELDGDELEEVVDELVEIQRVATRDGRALVWRGELNEPPTTATAEPSLERAAECVEITGARSYLPQIAVERAKLARLEGDEAGRERHLREAHRLYTEIGATGYAERVARELGETGA